MYGIRRDSSVIPDIIRVIGGLGLKQGSLLCYRSYPDPDHKRYPTICH
jgi:hypothetical protein